MVRPLANERQLQSLAKLGIEDLRPEFVEQLHQVRRKLLFQIKPKKLNGRLLSGPMVAQLARTYVGAINCGQVPNIEHAWSFISKQECQKALESSVAAFQAHLSLSTLPLHDCETTIGEASQKARLEFAQKVTGMEMGDFPQKLEDSLTKLAASFREQNVDRFHRDFKAYTALEAAKVKNALLSGKVETFY